MLDKNLGLNEEFFRESFISGLKGEIKHLVKMFKPIDLKTAIQLARLQEASLEAKKPKPWPTKNNTLTTHTYHTNQPSFNGNTTNN